MLNQVASGLQKKGQTTDCDIIFSKVKDRSDRKIRVEQFEEAIKEFAKIKKTSFEELSAMVS